MRTCSKKILPKAVKKWVKMDLVRRAFNKDPMEWKGIHVEEVTEEQIQNGATMINSILASDYIGFSPKRNKENH